MPTLGALACGGAPEPRRRRGARRPPAGSASLRGGRSATRAASSYRRVPRRRPAADWAGPPPTAYLVPFGAGDGLASRTSSSRSRRRGTPEALAQPWPFTLEVARVTAAPRGRASRRHADRRAVRGAHGAHAPAAPARPSPAGTYALEVANLGNAPATVQLAGSRHRRCLRRADRPARAADRSRAAARPRRCAWRRAGQLWWGRPVEHRINVDAPLPQMLAFRQLAWIPWWVPAAIAPLVALAIALLALRGDPPDPRPRGARRDRRRSAATARRRRLQGRAAAAGAGGRGPAAGRPRDRPEPEQPAPRSTPTAPSCSRPEWRTRS